jgi:hypothetical protein
MGFYSKASEKVLVKIPITVTFNPEDFNFSLIESNYVISIF